MVRVIALCIACMILVCPQVRAYQVDKGLVREILADLGLQVAIADPGTAWNGAIYFAAADPLRGMELWRSDGTPGGTMLVKDIYPGPGSSSPSGLFATEGLLYFQAFDPIRGRELWVSDGTAAGTRLVRDIAIGPLNGAPANFALLNGQVYFRAYEPGSGTELWTSDGTAAGTYMVRDIVPGFISSFPDELTVVGGKLFFRAFDLAHGTELWQSDGTPRGTVLCADTIPGGQGGAPSQLNVVGNDLYFRTRDARGLHLWKSDGTSAGTVTIEGLVPGKVQLSWRAPSFNTDGTALGDLAGYRIRHGSNPFILENHIDLPNPSLDSIELNEFPPGPQWFAVTAVNSAGVESGRSNIVFTLVR